MFCKKVPKQKFSKCFACRTHGMVELVFREKKQAKLQGRTTLHNGQKVSHEANQKMKNLVIKSK